MSKFVKNTFICKTYTILQAHSKNKNRNFMIKKIFFALILSTIVFSCNKDDDDEVTYLSQEDQIKVDTEGIKYLIAHYALTTDGNLIADINGDGDITDTDLTVTLPTGAYWLKDIVQPLSNGAYYAILPGKQGTGNTPDTNDLLTLNYGVHSFYAYTSTTGSITVNSTGKSGNIYSGTDPVTDPNFYAFDIDKYAKVLYGSNVSNMTKDQWNTMVSYYNDNNIYNRYVVSEFVEGIQKFKSREVTPNSPLSVQGIIIAPSANSKGQESYTSTGVRKDYITVFVVDLLKVVKQK